MGNGPTPFSEISKRAKDILTKGYYGCDKDILLSIQGSTPMELIAGLAPGQIFLGDTSVSTRLTFDEVMPHTKAIVSFEVPDPRSGQFDIEYRHPRVSIDASIGLNRSPILNLKAVGPYRDVRLLGQVGFNFAPASFTNYEAGIGWPKFGAALILTGMMDEGQTLAAYLHYSIYDSGKNQITAGLEHRFSSSENIITLKSAHVIDRYNTVKTRFSNNGNVSMLCQREWRPNSFITVSAEYDIIRPEVSPKWGLAMALNL